MKFTHKQTIFFSRIISKYLQVALHFNPGQYLQHFPVIMNVCYGYIDEISSACLPGDLSMSLSVGQQELLLMLLMVHR